jgi:polar amino acid transport system substrate-binding protein
MPECRLVFRARWRKIVPVSNAGMTRRLPESAAHMKRRSCTALFASLALALCMPPLASAACSRRINVPVSPIGLSVIVRGQEVSGVFPELLTKLGVGEDCAFTWSVVPRARLEVMFEQGQADLLIAATHSDRRDKFGLFIPLVSSRATLVAMKSERAPLHTMDQLLAHRELRVALVRGFDYGEPYLALSRKLAEQGRLSLQPDPLSVARLLAAGLVDVTIMPPSAIVGAVKGDARVEGMVGRLSIEPLEELPWNKSGVYISNKSLGKDDRAALEQFLTAAGKRGALWEAYQLYYPAAILAESTRPL